MTRRKQIQHMCRHRHRHRHLHLHQHIFWRRTFCTHAQSKQPQQPSDEDEDEDEYEDSSEYEYEYEYETDDEELEDNDNNDDDKQTATTSAHLPQQQPQQKEPSLSSTKSAFEISENFDFSPHEYEQTMAALFTNLPETGRLDHGKPVEHFISALILKPLEVLDDDIHNRFTLMHHDMHALLKTAYDTPMEDNESELRALMQLAFQKLHMYTHYIEHEFALRHSPKHYLMRQLRVDHRAVVFMVMRKIMYDKYPAWVASDNWATAEMSEENDKRFIIVERLGLQEDEPTDVDVDANVDGDDIGAMDPDDEGKEHAEAN